MSTGTPQACNEASNKINVGKTSYTSSDYRFMSLVHRGDNSNKETLIYIPYTSYLMSPSSEFVQLELSGYYISIL